VAYTREQLVQIARDAAEAAGIDPDLYVRQIDKESGFQISPTSPAGAQGIAQFMPATAAEWGLDTSDPVASLYTGARLMRQHLDYYDGNYELALAAYNAGAGRVDAVLAGQASLPAETNHYLDAILAGGSVGAGSLPPPSGGGGQVGWRTDPATGKMVYVPGDGGGTTNVPNSAQIEYNGQGQAFRYDPAVGDFVRAPELDDPSKSATFQSPAELEARAESARQADQQAATSRYSTDVSAATSRYGNDLQYASNAQDRAQQAYQFDQQQAFAKEQFLWQKQNDIQQLQLQQEQLYTQQAQNARQFVMEQQNLAFLHNKFSVETAFASRAEERATQAQLFGQQATVAGLQLEMESITQSARNLQAQLNQEVSIFNAAKAADVSMFNIDQQTKTAMFNSEGAFNAATFNESMKFNVAQANKQEERYLREEQMRVAQLISEAAADPGDRGKLASLIQAMSGMGFGGMDAALATTDLRTADSTAPLESFLRTREQIQAADTSPFDFTPVQWQNVQAGQASFTPAKAAQVQMPNFSGVQMPTPNTTPFNPASIPQVNPLPAPTADSTKQNFIASGGTTAANGQQFHQTGGGTLTAEQRASMPQAAIDLMIQQGLIPALAEGGNSRGAYIGDERGPELHVPFFQGGQRMQQVIPANQTQQMLGDVSSQPISPPMRRGMDENAYQSPPMQNMPQMGNVQMPQFGQMPNWDGQIAGMPARDVMMNGIPYRGGPRPTTPAQPPAQVPGAPPAQPAMPQFNFEPQVLEYLKSIGHPFGNMPQMADGGIVEGAYLGNDDGDAMHIPIPGTNMTIIMPKGKGKSKSKGMKKMADGGIFENAGRSIFEGLVDDTDRTRAQDFLDKAGQRATAGTPFDINRLPTPVFASSPGSSRFVTDLLGSLNALRRGIPMEYFQEQANLLRPAGFSEGVIGRTR
jgi:hypothetical protein